MGFLKEKYTREYFTGLLANGEPAGYGALGADEWRAGSIFREIKEPIDSIDLYDNRVLEIGYGRGESARYMLEKKGVREYLGVDFSDVAHQLARESLAGIAQEFWQLKLADALEFMQTARFESCFDAAFMLDTIEHIPRIEVAELLPLLLRSLKSGGYLIIDTPFYGVDEDYIEQGYEYVEPSTSDLHPATRGMHCNKFTRERLLRDVSSAGFKILGDKKFQKPSFPLVHKALNRLRKRSARMNIGNN